MLKPFTVNRKNFWAPLALLSGLLLLLPFQNLANADDDDRERYLGSNAVDVRVISDYAGPLREYPVKQNRRLYRAYLEARRGDQYALEISNRTPHRIGLAIAVDGRNIISGRRSELRSNERLYILDPYETAVYRGWRSGRDRVNRFYFTDAGDSYAASWGDRSAMGVIAVAAYRERAYRRDDSYQYDDFRRGPSRLAPDANARRSQPGTGFGEENYSPSRRVEFEPAGRAMARVFLKYEWRETLCKRGVIDCYRDTRYDDDYNRFWKDRDDRYPGWRREDDLGFAPPPPRR